MSKQNHPRYQAQPPVVAPVVQAPVESDASDLTSLVTDPRVRIDDAAIDTLLKAVSNEEGLKEANEQEAFPKEVIEQAQSGAADQQGQDDAHETTKLPISSDAGGNAAGFDDEKSGASDAATTVVAVNNPAQLATSTQAVTDGGVQEQQPTTVSVKVETVQGPTSSTQAVTETVFARGQTSSVVHIDELAVREVEVEEKFTPVKSAQSNAQSIGMALTPRGRALLEDLELYIDAMSPGRPIVASAGPIQQARLFRTLTAIINDLEEDFVLAFTAVIDAFNEHSLGAFNAVNVFRHFATIPLNEDQRTSFRALLNLLTKIAPPLSRREVLRQVNLHATLEGQSFKEQGRQRIFNYFGQ